MSLNAAPMGERLNVCFFGVRNAGKSSLVNAVTGQDLAVVSDTLGTTTDLVKKPMELLPAGPVVVVDTPGIDDAGELGSLRVERAEQALRSCDVAVLVADATRGASAADERMAAAFERRGVPFLLAWNKIDLAGAAPSGCALAERAAEVVSVSALTGAGVEELKEAIGRLGSRAARSKRLLGDLLAPGDTVVLVVPIDASAPKGRIILPQQMVLRDVLDARAAAVVCQPEELPAMLAGLRGRPRIVVTDSQAFAQVAAVVPAGVQLTSFSILMARYKGNLAQLVAGAERLAELTAQSRVLVSEGCTHHRQCEDIGTVKIPRWIEEYTGCRPRFEFTSGGEFPADISAFDLVVHCGGCMLNEREMQHRLHACAQAGVAVVNYGMAIAEVHGILDRAMEPFS